MSTFFSDIDNTLIFSHSREFDGEKIVVEYLEGKEQSYMPSELFFFLKQNNIVPIPVTTRSIEQYQRLSFFSEKLMCKYAIICNGGIMLENGKIDKKWKEETLNISEVQNKEVENMYQYVLNNLTYKAIYYLNEFMFYFISEEADKQCLIIRKIADLSKVSIVKHSRKVYVIAKSINKGNAIKRFKKRYGIGNCIVAGDSELDISMLELGNPAIASPCLKRELKNKNAIYSKQNMLVSEISSLLERSINDRRI